MSEQVNNGKGFLKEKLGDYQVSPPEKVWDSIASQLGGRSRRRVIIITLSAAAAFALAVTLGINYFGPQLSEKAELADTHENVSQAPDLENENTGIVQDITTESESKKQRETLEEKVVRTLDDIQVADNQDTRQSIAEAETTLQIEVPLQQQAVGEEISDQEITDQEITDQDVADQEITDQEDKTTVEDQDNEPSVDIVTDPGKEVASDQVEEFREKQPRDSR
ncbi:MAG: hypothetical protein KAT15_22640, partial [Bacteroidales bacterium]|nr:hypothetical protein [Bacteroidales bacterium]